MTPEPANLAREAEAETRLGATAFAAGEAAAGEAHLRRALELEPSRLDRRLLLARLFSGSGLDRQAQAEFEALAAEPEVPAPILAQTGAALAALGQPHRSAALFARAVAAGGARAPLVWRMSWVNQLDRLAPAPGDVDGLLANRREAEQVLGDGLRAFDGDEEACRPLADRLKAVRSQIDRALATSAASRSEAAFAAGDVEFGAAELRRAIALAPHRHDYRVLLIRLLAVAARAQDCSAEVDILAGEAETPAASLAQCAAVEAGLGHSGRAAVLLERAVAARGQAAPAEWWAMWANQLDRMAAEAPGLAAFLDNRRQAAAMLRRALTQTPPEAAVMLTHRLANVLWQLDDPDLATLGAAITATFIAATGVREAALMAPILQDVVPSNRLLAWLAAGRAAHRDRLELLKAEVSLCLADRAALLRLWPDLLAAARERPDDIGLEELTGLAAYELGRWPEALDRLRAAAARRSSIDLWWRAGQTALYLGHDADAEAAFAHVSPRLPAAALGPPAEALTELLTAVNRLYLHTDGVDHQALAATLERSVADLKSRLAGLGPWKPATLIDAAWAVRMVRNEPFANLAMVPRQHGFITRFDARYGTLDLAAFALVHHALAEHEAALLCAAALDFSGGAMAGGLRVARTLPERLADVLLELDRPVQAREILVALRAQGLTGRNVAAALERCDLQQGKVEAVNRRWRKSGTSASTHRIAYADEWHRHEGLTTTPLWREAGIAGVVERAKLDGAIERFGHRTRPFTLSVTKVSGLEVRESELIIGPRGTLLRPSDWHMISGVFPDRYAGCLAAARRGAVLRAPPVQTIEAPIVVLAGADPVSVPNYYHWMIHQLTRAVWALKQGWLDDRRLLVPARSRPWMFEALRLAGVGDEQILIQPEAVTFHLADAWLVSAFEHPGAALVLAVHQQLWERAGVLAEASPRRCVFLTRPLGFKAPAYEADALLKIVRATGFECVDPSELSIADQVRLAADARAIAGFDGAAMTNLMFARNGVRVLDLTCEATHWPDFTGIAIALGQRFRYLSCAIPPPCRAPLFLNMAPVQCDLKLLERQLRWAQDR